MDLGFEGHAEVINLKQGNIFPDRIINSASSEGDYQRHNYCQHLSEILNIIEKHLSKTIFTQISQYFGKVRGASKRLKKCLVTEEGK